MFFALHYDINSVFEYRKNELKFERKYTEQIHRYLQKHDNCFTLLPSFITDHFLTLLIHKHSEEGIRIYVIDSHNDPKNDECGKLQHSLKDHFQERHPAIRCESYYVGAYDLNFGGENRNIYEDFGYCQLIGYLFMNILYTNIVVYKKLPFNATHEQVFDFINNMKQYCTKYFKDENTPSDKLWKFKLICYNFDYKVMKSMNVINTDENTPLDGTYYEKLSLNYIRNREIPYDDIIARAVIIRRTGTTDINKQNENFTFKTKLVECVLTNAFMHAFIGINWQNDPDYTVITQKDNNYYYFVPELIDLMNAEVDSDI